MKKPDPHSDGEYLSEPEYGELPLSDSEAKLLARLGSISEFGVDSLYNRLKERGLISVDDSQEL